MFLRILLILAIFLNKIIFYVQNQKRINNKSNCSHLHNIKGFEKNINLYNNNFRYTIFKKLKDRFSHTPILKRKFL